MKNNWKKCPNCSPTEPAVNVQPETNIDIEKPIWKCVNCGHEWERKIYKTKKRIERQKRMKLAHEILDGLA